MYRCLISACILILSANAAKAQQQWLIRDERNSDFLLTVSADGDKVGGHTRSGALVDYLGAQRFSMIKMAYPVKFPEIIRFTATLQPGSRRFSGVWNMLYTEYSVEGVLDNDSLVLQLLDKNHQTVSHLQGTRVKDTGRLPGRRPEAEKLISLTEQNLYNPSLLLSPAWVNLKEKLLLYADSMKDDLELRTAVYALSLSLPFSHYGITGKTAPAPSEPIYGLSALNDSTALLKINRFSGGGAAMDSIVGRIAAKNYHRLIIDLRNNGGGDNETALVLGAFLMNKDVISGVFPNKNWYAQHTRYPMQADLSLFTEFTKGTLQDFYRKAAEGPGVYIHNKPASRSFKGQVFLLVGEGTASTAEAFALALKETGTATLVGKKTAGRMLSGKPFSISDRLDITIPVNDYISAGGYRIDKKGVLPDINPGATDALAYIMQTRFPGN